MKTKYVFLSIFLALVLTLSIFGQAAKKAKAKPIIKKNDISIVMGKPVYESTADSLRIKAWIITQKKYKEMLKTAMGKTMSKMKDKDMKMNKDDKKLMITGTHYFIFDVTNIITKKEFADSSAKVEIVYPSKKSSSVTLQPMLNHFGGGVTLNEKGGYLFTINLNIGMSYKTTQFKYKVK